MRTGKHTKLHGGFSLAELTLVIAVLLGLITILFLGVSAYKEGSNRAMCILNMSHVQKAIRSYQNLYQRETGDSMTLDLIAGPGKLLHSAPVCPSGGNYDGSLTTIPAPGVRYLFCSLGSGEQGHAPNNTTGW